MEGTIGEIRMFAGNFAPRAWAYCAGQLLSIAQNEALFSIIGCTFGGDCRTSFALPDLRGRSPIGPGTGPGLPSYRYGSRGGLEQTNLNILHLASHNHGVTGTVTAQVNHVALNDEGNTTEPDGAVPAMLTPDKAYANTHDSTMGEDEASVSANLITTNAGSSASVNTMAPFLTMNWIICLFGVYPSRN